MTNLKTREYRLVRLEISLLTAEQYLRGFWWLIVGAPATGIACIAMGSGLLQALGVVLVLWPLTIPARGFLLSSKAARQMLKPTELEVTKKALLFKASDGTGSRLALDSVWLVRKRRKHYVIWTRRLAFVPVPIDAFEAPEAQAKFERALGMDR